MSGEALMSKVLKGFETAVNSQNSDKLAEANGLIEDLLTHSQAEELTTRMLVALQEGLSDLVEGGSEWDHEFASAKLSILFKMLHYLVKSLVKSNTTLQPTQDGSPFQKFADCAMQLAEAQVDVGRRVDLNEALLGFIKELGIYDQDFSSRLFNSAWSARSEILAQALVQYAEAKPRSFFEEVDQQLSGKNRVLTEHGDEVEEVRLFVLEVLSSYCSQQRPGMHEVTDTGLLHTLINTILFYSQGSKPAPSKIPEGQGADISKGQGSDGQKSQASKTSGAEEDSDKPTYDSRVEVSTEVSILTMFLPQLGPRLPALIPSLVKLLVHVIGIDPEQIEEHSSLSIKKLKGSGGSSSQRRTSKDLKLQRLTDGMAIPRAERWSSVVHEFLRHLFGLFPCHCIEHLRKALKERVELTPKLEQYLPRLRLNTRMLQSLESEANPENWRTVHMADLIEHDCQPKQSSAGESLLTKRSSYADISDTGVKREHSRNQDLKDFEDLVAEGLRAEGSDGVRPEDDGPGWQVVRHLQRKATLLTSDIIWERYMRQQACEQLRDIQRSHSTARAELSKLQAQQAYHAKLRDEIQHLQADLHRERQAVNQLEKSKREWESSLRNKINKNSIERQRMVEQLRQAEATTAQLSTVNAQLMRDVAERDRSIVRLQTDVKKLAGAKVDCGNMRDALDNFHAEVQDRSSEETQVETLRKQLNLSGIEVRRLTIEKESLQNQISKRNHSTSELEAVVERLERENQEIKRNLELAKSHITLQNKVNEEKVSVVESKYEEIKKLNLLLVARAPIQRPSMSKPPDPAPE